MKWDGGSAFPVKNETDYFRGMSLRDYFAAKALNGYCAANIVEPPSQLADWSYELADAMLKAREQK